MNKIASYIGLAQRANDVIYGEDQIKEKIKLVKIVLIDINASDKFKERVIKKFDNVATFLIKDLNDLIHKDNVKIIGIKNEELSKAIINNMR